MKQCPVRHVTGTVSVCDQYVCFVSENPSDNVSIVFSLRLWLHSHTNEH